MHYRYSRSYHLLLISVSALLLITLYNLCAKNGHQQEKLLPVRVLLASVELGSQEQLSLVIPAGYELHSKTEKTKKAVLVKTDLPNLFIKPHHDFFTANERKITAHPVIIKPNHQEFVFGGHTYHGLCELLVYGKKLLIINVVPLEEYVSSVLRTESWPGWPLEVNKVFAITSRSYALAMMLRAQKKKKPYHIKNTNVNQTYQGLHTCDTIKTAVAQTRGMFLMYDKQPIVAMFDCCCGGLVPALLDGVDFVAAPYLARTYACHHCRECKIYQWKAAFEEDVLDAIFATKFPKLGKIRTITITKRDKAGAVREVVVTGNMRTAITLSGQQFGALFKEIKSAHFEVTKARDRKTMIEGRGYGHHVGLCQWGAREMVRDGWGYKRILQFYYPGTSFTVV